MIRKLLALLAIVFVAGAVGGMLDGMKTTPEEMRSVLVKECAEHYGQRMPGDKATAFCECTIDKMMKDHTVEELTVALRVGGPTPEWVKEEDLRNSRQCAGRLELQINIH